MPPKKKKGGKPEKSAKGSSREASMSETHSEVMEELNTEYFILHIQDLERRYKRYEEKLSRLESANKSLLEKHTLVSKDKKESIRFLQVTLENKRDELADLQDRLEGLQQAKDAEKDMYEGRLQKLRTELQEMKDQLTSENNILAAKLAALEEFKRQKEMLWERYNALVQKRDSLLQQQDLNVENLSNKTLLDRDRLKKEMVQRVNQVAAEFRKVSNKQMADTTKRLIRENVSIQTQLVKMADKVADLVEENEDMRLRGRKEQQLIRRLEKESESFAKKCSCHHKIIHMLTIKRDEQLAQIELFEEEEKSSLEVEDKNEEMRQSILEMKTRIEALQEEIEIVQADHDTQEADVTTCNASIHESKVQLMEAIIALRDILQHNPLLPRIASNSTSHDPRRSAGAPLPSIADINPSATAEKLLNRLIESLCTNKDNLSESARSSEASSSIDQLCSSSLGRSISLPPSRATLPKSATAPGFRGNEFKTLKAQPSGPISFEKVMADGETLLKKAAKGYCVPGSLQIIPSASFIIPTQVEKNQMQKDKKALSKREQALWSQLTDRPKPVHHHHLYSSSVCSSKPVGVQTSSTVKAAAMAAMKPPHLLKELV